ncbi:MAG TPA: cobalt-precorrin-6A reductase [Xanthobacteraceae bacterium]|jgi:precorrin-6A/cobalt-precorrin-6A reductase|nr:cobalt-precorrin-6A reductase [Xanthobacteraceae bacterium]
MARPLRVLILGGTTEARRLAERLAPHRELDVRLSLAGRTSNPVPHAVPLRVGGFGGADGLAAYLKDERIDRLVDATHPYAAQMSANAAQAARLARVPLLALRRAAWQPATGDRWREVDDARAAAQALGDAPRRVFLALGRNEIAPFAGAPQHFYLVRSVDAVEPPLAVPRAVYIRARGPFREEDDRALLATHEIDVVVAKNSGGPAAYGKIAAARLLGIAVMLLRRPALPEVRAVDNVDDAVAWLAHAGVSAARGV